MIIEIEALDTLFFRDGKPFSMGDDTWANGMFPPLPGVIYGAIRSAYMAQNNISLDDVVEVTKVLQIKNIWFKVKANEKTGRNSNAIYFPMPLDLVRKSDLEKKEQSLVDKYKSNSIYSTKNQVAAFASHLGESNFNLSETLVFEEDENIENLTSGVFTKTSLENYIKGQKEFEGRELDDYIESEPKIGISRDNGTRTSADGNLYRVGMLRVDNIRVFVEFYGLELDKKGGLLKLGAENKIAIYKCWDDDEDPIDLRLSTLNITPTNTFRIYLSTPAIFLNGFYPTKIFNDANVKEKLLTCAVGKSLNVGGFDIKGKVPKTMQRAVPAGSVYYYQLEDGNLSDLENLIFEKGISESRGVEGFGNAFLTTVNP